MPVKTIAFLKLIRFQNLLMIALTQVLLRYFVLQKVWDQYEIDIVSGHWLFFMVVLSTVLIAAGGYVINDYFDVKTDTINHPETVVVDRVIDRRWAIFLHIAFTVTGVVLGMYAALKTGYLRLAIFHIAAALLLWFYSIHFKRQLLTGNIAVALLTAAVTFMPFIFEISAMEKSSPGFIYQYRYAVLSGFKYAWVFSIFAFVTTLAREVIKDLEDEEGDRATGCKTMPVVWGDRSARLTAFFLILITVLLLLFALYNTVRSDRTLLSSSSLFISLLLVVPLFSLGIYVLRSNRTNQYTNASLALKCIMLAGLLYSIVFYYS